MRPRFSFLQPAKSALAFIAICSAFAGGEGRARAENNRENEVRAAMIFNFARFTRWPEGAFADSKGRLTICAPRESALSAALQRIEGKRIRGKEIAIRKKTNFLPGPHGCHVVIITAPLSEEANWLRNGNTLIISLEENVASDIASIELVSVGRQVRFVVNPAAARASGVEISSKLIDLAVRVR